jgi:predicted ester cyclase
MDNIALLRHALGTFQAADLDAAVELLTPDFLANIPGVPTPLRGRDIWRMGAQSMLDGFPDLRIDIEDIFGAGDRVAVRLRFEGTHDGPFQGVEPTHRKVTFTSVEIYRFAGGRIAEEWVSPDMFGLMRQITA